jgi:hypothetical protein
MFLTYRTNQVYSLMGCIYFVEYPVFPFEQLG